MNMLSPLLGVDKSNPLLELLFNPEFPDEILVHYGMHLLEKVHRGADSIEEKLLAGRLYNAGLKRKNLVKVFNWDLKTIQGYGEALKSGDADRLRSVLSGQGQERKVGELEDRFIRSTFREVYEEKGCHTNSYDPEELQSKFDRGMKRGAILGAANKMKYWDLYSELYQVMTQHPPGQFPHLFAEELARAYEAAAENGTGRTDDKAASAPAA